MALPAVPVTVLEDSYEGDLDDFGYSEGWFDRKLAEAVAKVQSRWGAVVEPRLTGGTLAQVTYEAVICEAVLRVARNTNGYRGEQEGNYQYQQDVTVAAGKLFFTDENIEDLTGSNPRRSGKMGTAVVEPHGGWR